MDLFSSLILIVCYFIYKLVRFLLMDPPPFWSENDMNNHGPGTRKLNFMETMLIKDPKGVLNLCNGLVVRSKKQISEDVIRKALRMLLERHPLLGKCVAQEENDKDSFYFRDIEIMDVDMRVSTSQDWKMTLEDEIMKSFDTRKGPLWRVVFLPKVAYEDGEKSENFPYQSACVFCFNHIIVDGTSYARLFGEFQSRLNEILEDKHSEITPMELLPPLDKYINELRTHSIKERLTINVAIIVNSFPFIQGKMVSAFKRNLLFMENRTKEEFESPDMVKRTRIVPVELPKLDTSKLLAACKKRKVKVHGALQTAAAFAYIKLVKGDLKNLEKEIKVGATPTVNMRPFLKTKVANDQLGCYFFGTPVVNDIGPNSSFWEIAEKSDKNLHDNLDNMKMLGMFMFIHSCPNLFLQLEKAFEDAPGKRRDDLVFTNLGNLSFLNCDDSSTVKISARFGCSAEHEHGNVFANNVCTFNGKLFWTFVYYSHILEEEVAEKFAKLTVDTLLEAIED